MAVVVPMALLLLVAYGLDDLKGPHDPNSCYGSNNSYGANGFTCFNERPLWFSKGSYALGALMAPMALLSLMAPTASMGPYNSPHESNMTDGPSRSKGSCATNNSRVYSRLWQ